jgi:hypothetical protein
VHEDHFWVTDYLTGSPNGLGAANFLSLARSTAWWSDREDHDEPRRGLQMGKSCPGTCVQSGIVRVTTSAILTILLILVATLFSFFSLRPQNGLWPFQRLPAHGCMSSTVFFEWLSIGTPVKVKRMTSRRVLRLQLPHRSVCRPMGKPLSRLARARARSCLLQLLSYHRRTQSHPIAHTATHQLLGYCALS